MKKIVAVLLSLMILITFTACGRGTTSQPKTDGLSVVVTIFPEYNWAREIIGDKAGDVDLTLLLDNGADLHSYQPSAEDIMKISSADVFVYVGGESDEWVDDVLEKTARSDMTVINLMDVIGGRAKEEEVVEGMQADDDHDHDDPDHDEDHDDDHDDSDHDVDHDEDHDDEDYDDAPDLDEDRDSDHDEDHSGDPEYDEHVWLSLKNAEIIVSEMAEAFADADTANAETYRDNSEKYIKKLKGLDSEYEVAIRSAEKDTLLFGDRFPFRYMTDDYGLKYYAAFVGCSAETEASFDTVTFLANKIDELALRYVMVIDGSDAKLADTIIKNTESRDQDILTLDSLQSIGVKEIEDGKTYLGVMENNLKVLKKALS